MKLTPKKKLKFIELLEEGAFIKDAAKEIGVTPAACYKERKLDKDWRELWEAAYEVGNQVRLDLCNEELMSRATKGFPKGVYYKGRRVGWHRVVSDTLLMFYLKRLDPLYRERVDITSGDEAVAGLVVIPAPAADEESWQSQFSALKPPRHEGG